MDNEMTVIKLIVNNHPGVMSHITGLFARRAFNLEGILCGNMREGETNCVFLLVSNSKQTDQIVKQLDKLEDTIEVTSGHDYDRKWFDTISTYIKEPCNY